MYVHVQYFLVQTARHGERVLEVGIPTVEDLSKTQVSSAIYVIRDGSRERGRRYNVADVTSHVTSPDSLTPRVSQSVRLTGGGWRHACASAGRARVVNACTFFAPHPSPHLAWIESVRVCRPGQGLPFGGPAQGRDSGGLSPTTITTRNTHATRSRRRLYNENHIKNPTERSTRLHATPCGVCRVLSEMWSVERSSVAPCVFGVPVFDVR